MSTMTVGADARLEALLAHAVGLGLTVEWQSGMDPHEHAYYEHDVQRIVVNANCTTRQAISALAHEIGHAVFGDTRSTERIEARADEYAAALLITRRRYEAASAQAGQDLGRLAQLLGVTRDLVHAWQRRHVTA